MSEIKAPGCSERCAKRVTAIAYCRGGSGSVVICLTCGECLTKNHGLSENEIAAIVAVARTLKANKASSRLTTHKAKPIGGNNGETD